MDTMENHRSTAIDDRELPRDVAEQFRVALGLAAAPATLDDWVDATASRLQDAGVSVGFEELCLTESSRHEARVGDEVRYFACVLDALLLPFVLDEPARVDVRSRSPVSDAVVEATVTRGGVSVDPEGAVASLGVAADVDPAAERGDPLAYGRAAFCPYVNAFPDADEYEAWDEATPAAVTTSLPLSDGFAIAGALAARLTE